MRVEAIRQIFDNKKKLIAGVGLGGGDLLLGQGIQLAAATEGATVGLMRPIIENHSSAVVLAGAITAGFIVAAVGAYQNTRLLKEKEIGVSPNAVGTFVFHTVDKKWPEKDLVRDTFVRLSLPIAAKDFRLIAPIVAAFNLIDKIWPSKETARDRVTQAAQVFGTKDYFLIAPALANETTLVAFVTAKAAGSLFNLFKAGVIEGVLRKAGKKRKRAKEQDVKEVETAGLVFDANDAKVVPIAAGD